MSPLIARVFIFPHATGLLFIVLCQRLCVVVKLQRAQLLLHINPRNTYRHNTSVVHTTSRSLSLHLIQSRRALIDEKEFISQLVLCFSCLLSCNKPVDARFVVDPEISDKAPRQPLKTLST